MCRMLVYCSDVPILLFDLIHGPSNSLVQQSFCGGFHPQCERKNNMTLNADGFGIGWYGCGAEVRARAATFKSITPAWSNRNLRELTAVVKSRCCFAHVRAATPGSVVNEENCHPFRYGRLLWQHNGHIEAFSKLKRRILAHVRCDEVYAAVGGATDSEHCFALFLAQLDRPKRADSFKALELEVAMRKTIGILTLLLKEEGIHKGFSTCNFALTDGESVVITRFCDKSPRIPPPSMYFAFTDVEMIHAELASGRSDRPAQPAYGLESDADRQAALFQTTTAKKNEGGANKAMPRMTKKKPVANDPCRTAQCGSSSFSTSSLLCGKTSTFQGRESWRCQRTPAFMCSSEPLTHRADEWTLVPENTMLTYSLARATLEMSTIEKVFDAASASLEHSRSCIEFAQPPDPATTAVTITVDDKASSCAVLDCPVALASCRDLDPTLKAPPPLATAATNDHDDAGERVVIFDNDEPPEADAAASSSSSSSWTTGFGLADSLTPAWFGEPAPPNISS